jgi:hypothetical protein
VVTQAVTMLRLLGMFRSPLLEPNKRLSTPKTFLSHLLIAYHPEVTGPCMQHQVILRFGRAGKDGKG